MAAENDKAGAWKVKVLDVGVGSGVWGSQRAQYPLIKLSTLNYKGLHIMI